MTACTNKARGAVVAALAGVLALGAVPAVALATGTADAQVDLLVAEDAFEKGTIGFGGTDTVKAEKDGSFSIKANKDGSALDIEVISVTPVGADAISLVDNDDYKVELVGPDGAVTDTVAKPGEYTVKVIRLEDSAECTAKLVVKTSEFNINAFEAYEGNDTDDKTFIYTGDELDIHVHHTMGLVEGEDYTYKIVKDGTDELADAPAVDVVEAGTYWAYVEGIGQFEGYHEAFDFEVEKFDISKADIIVNDVIGSEKAPTTPDKVVIKDGQDGEGTELDPSLVKLTFKKLFDENGPYSFTASAADPDNANVIWPNTPVTVNVDKVAKKATFEYNGEAIEDSYVIDKSKKEAFDYSKISVTGGDIEGKKGQDFKVTVRNEKGELGEYGNLEDGVAGTYLVTVDVVNGASSQFKYNYGGTVTFTVKVIEGAIDADAQVYVSYDGEAVTSVTKNYDGKPIKPGDFGVTVVDEDGKDITNTLTVNIKLVDAEGKTVKSITDAGEYKLVVSVPGYEVSGTTEVPVTINKIDASELDLKGSVIKSWSGAEYVEEGTELTSCSILAPYYNTGVADSDNNDTANDLEGWDALTNFTSSIWDSKYVSVEQWDAEEEEWVKVALGTELEVGDYRLVVKGDDAIAKNFTFADGENHVTTVAFKVADKDNVKFTDVTPNDWFFNCVGVMAGNNDWGRYSSGLQIVKGYADTDAFGPNDTITRADVAVILYRMAQGQDSSFVEPDLGYTENQGWVTGFSDIDDAGLGNMYFAKAVGWANKAGVVNGYDDGTFGPYDEITREQLATMLANFAKNVYRDEVSLVEGELDAMPDGGSVSVWAEKAVSWCLENELMGNDGSIRPGDTITRAETAAMAYNYLTKVVGWEK